MRSRVGAGLVAGSAAGLVMSAAMMSYMRWRGESLWTGRDRIAAMRMGPEAADGRLTLATLIGSLTHLAARALMGVIAVPFVCGLPPWHTMLAAFSYALASYPASVPPSNSTPSPDAMRFTKLK